MAKEKNVELVEVKHNKCGQIIGHFGAGDDHGCIEIRCPKCHKLITIENGLLQMLQDSLSEPEDEQMTDNPHKQDGCTFTAMKMKTIMGN
jgi:hypothetical protein